MNPEHRRPLRIVNLSRAEAQAARGEIMNINDFNALNDEQRRQVARIYEAIREWIAWVRATYPQAVEAAERQLDELKQRGRT
jgi:hypothetical protein